MPGPIRVASLKTLPPFCITCGDSKGYIEMQNMVDKRTGESGEAKVCNACGQIFLGPKKSPYEGAGYRLGKAKQRHTR